MLMFVTVAEQLSATSSLRNHEFPLANTLTPILEVVEVYLENTLMCIVKYMGHTVELIPVDVAVATVSSVVVAVPNGVVVTVPIGIVAEFVAGVVLVVAVCACITTRITMAATVMPITRADNSEINMHTDEQPQQHLSKHLHKISKDIYKENDSRNSIPSFKYYIGFFTIVTRGLITI
ncbi:unnamed protein product [Rotaria magnacalcarata]|uniref:Uncharacterized protein n=2 Tax=Rotaria magnacalcarata TaxID=392030 RepID=A0A816F938_9BILA|nr:unnamed protein product [Rotaria magnacalcarata]